jgi:hypothetical protein
MRLRRCAAALSAAVLVIALGGASGGIAQAGGGATAGPDLSTPEAAKAYLISQGFDPSKFIFQVGVKNYAGSSCPGLGWNCTTANLVVQIATAGGVNYAECGVDARQCVIVQGSNAQVIGPLQADDDVNMHAHCPPENKRLMLKESGALTCTITQINPTTGNNHAVVGMSIHDNDDPTQFAQEDATVTQSTNGDGDNHAVVHEEIVLHTSDGSTQKQDGFQSLKLTQEVTPLTVDTEVIPATGDNFGDVKQTQHFTARAKSDGSVQLQQTTERPGGDPCIGPTFDANTCVEFRQTTGEGGRNDLNVHQDHNVDAVAAGEGADQTQGCTSKACGLELDGSQTPFGSTNSVHNDQSIHYTLNGPEGTTQIQDPPIKNGPGFQTGSEFDLWWVRQLAVLKANDADDYGDSQAHINEVADSSTGTVDAQSVIILNDERSEIVCDASSCNYVQACGDVDVEVPEDPCPEFREEEPPID